jgi:hypothetical protein
MAEYLPPTENVAIFDTLNFNAGDEALTYNKAVKYFLRYPIAQGTETLQAITVNGIASFLNTVNIGSSTTANNTPTVNTYKSVVNLGSGGMGTINVECPLNVGGFGSVGLLNADITMTDDSYINQNGTHTTPNSLYSVNLTTGSRIQYPDGKQQNSAFTGGTPGTYTNTNMTIDANGKISAISSGATGSTAVVKLAQWNDVWNPAGFPPLRINTSGGPGSGSWSLNENFTVRIKYSVYYNKVNIPNQNYQFFATTIGTVTFWPYRWNAPWYPTASSGVLSTNAINGNTTFNYKDATYAPYGRQWFDTDLKLETNDVGNTGINLLVWGTSGYAGFYPTVPTGAITTQLTYSLNVELIDAGNASFGASSLTTSGFTINF